MEIRDVIGDLRTQIHELRNEINALKLAIHILEWRLSKMDNVSRETKEENSGTVTTQTPSEIAVSAPEAETRLGAGPLPRKPRHKRGPLKP